MMKAKGKSYSVIIVGGASSSNKEFVISSKFIRNSIIGFIVFLSICGYIIFDYLNTSLNREELTRLERENIEKKATLNKLSETIEDIEKRVYQMAIYAKKISVVVNLTSPWTLNDIGFGGGGGEDGVDGDSIPGGTGRVKVPGTESMVKSKEPKPTRENVLKKAENIRKKTKNIHGRLNFVEDALKEQKVRIDSIPYIWPTKGYLTSSLGWRTHPLTGHRDYHKGQDIATQYGNKVVATGNGVVLAAEHWVYLGNFIIIDHGFGFTTRYGHLASFNVKAGDRVKRFQVIGYVGNSGKCSSPHLHYEIRYFGKPLNPINFIID